jgi:hypothetical protein
LALACAALAAGCGGGDDDGETQTSPDNVLTLVFERSFAECGSESLDELAGKHNVSRNSAAVSTAVAQYWAEQFGGHEDAVREGKLGCLQSIALDSPPGQTKKSK